MADRLKSVLSFGSMTLLVGGLALAGLLLWGWKTGQELPLWPALLVAAVNLFGAYRLVREARARQTALQALKQGQTPQAPRAAAGRVSPGQRSSRG